MGGQASGSYESWTCTAADVYNDGPFYAFGATYKDVTSAELWSFKNRCTGDPDRISEITVGFADGFADNDTVTPGDTVFAPVKMEVLTEGLTWF
jgi:acetamidase/formamidase